MLNHFNLINNTKELLLFLAVILIIFSCQEKDHVVIHDLPTEAIDYAFIKTDGITQKSSRFYRLFSDSNENQYIVYYDQNAHWLRFIHINNHENRFHVPLPEASKSEFGLTDFLIHSRDSIFIVPDYYGRENTVFLCNQLGKVIQKYDFHPNLLDNSTTFAFKSTYSNRISFKNPFLTSHIIFLNFSLHQNGRFAQNYTDFLSRPNFAQINVKDGTLRPLQVPYDSFENPKQYYNEVFWAESTLHFFAGYRHTPYVFKFKKFDSGIVFKDKLDVRDVIPFDFEPSQEFEEDAIRKFETDNLMQIYWDEKRNLLFVFMKKGMPYLNKNGVTKNDWKDKLSYMLIFDENLNHIKSLHLSDFDEISSGWTDGLSIDNFVMKSHYRQKTDTIVICKLDINKILEAQ